MCPAPYASSRSPPITTVEVSRLASSQPPPSLSLKFEAGEASRVEGTHALLVAHRQVDSQPRRRARVNGIESVTATPSHLLTGGWDLGQGSTPLRWRCGLCKHTARKNHIYEHWGLHAEVEPYLDQVVVLPAKANSRSAVTARAVERTGADSDGADGLMELAFAVAGTAHVSALPPYHGLVGSHFGLHSED